VREIPHPQSCLRIIPLLDHHDQKMTADFLRCGWLA
jgi:hypothetical protein